MGKILLAKSEPKVSLIQHTRDGLSVWENLQIAFPLTSVIANKENFWWLLRLAIITHDLGKSHEEFQKILKGDDDNKWYKQRHELFSLPFTNKLPLLEEDKTIVLRVVAGHHRSYKWLRCFIADNYGTTEDFFEEFQKVDIEGAIEIVNELENNLIARPVLPIHPKKIITDYKIAVRRANQLNDEKKQSLFMQLLMMGAFHQCDHLSSGFITSFPCFKDADFHFLDVLRANLRKKKYDFYKHQVKAIQTINHCILTAPTGSGKTETAMLWLRNQLNITGQGRTFYILPFTASINAMFERLGNEEEGFGNNLVGMLHGKVNAYLYENFFEEEGDLRILKDKIKSVKEQFKNLETPIKVSTPFQLLKHLFGLKGFEKGIFEWTGGYFIFDEIHAYDPKVTAQIIVLLEFIVHKMRGKIFIMTATLPTFLKERIKIIIKENYTEIKADDDLYEGFKRHKLKLEEGLLSNNYQLIENALKKYDKVLVVCNTVDSSRNVYNQFKENYNSLLIHGRFAAKDRNNIEKSLREEPPKLLIGTQAIEVSLDIDYDIIFTEPAPLDALIQRFGRVNRKRLKKPSPCIVFKERGKKDKFIYGDEIISKTLEVLEEISSKNESVIKEIELQKYIDYVYPSFDEKAKEDFDLVYENLKKYVNRLFPFNPSKEGEEAYYKQFDGVKIVPAYYENTYRSLIEQFNFIGADLLKVSLRSSRFNQFNNTSAMESSVIIVKNPYRTDSKPIEIQYYKLNKKYEPSTGLNFDVDEIVINSSQFDV